MLDDLASGMTYAAHGFCLFWEPALIGLHAGSDALTAVSYLAIPLAIWRFMRLRGDLDHRWVGWLFAAFITLCALGHVLSLLTLWVPAYWLAGGVKAATGLVSAATAAMLFWAMPHALRLPSPATLRRVNAELEAERASLERRVRERTAELEREVAERRRSEAQVAEYAERLRRSNEELTLFARRIAHDLRDPISSALGFAQLALDPRFDAHRREEHVEVVAGALANIDRMIVSLYDFSKVDRDRNPWARVRLDAVIDDTLAGLRGEIDRTGAAIMREPAPVELEADKGLLLVLLQNVIANALKHADADPQVRIAAVDEGQSVLVRVEDNGIGIPDAQKERVFGLFERLARSSAAPGMGVGLATARRVVELHGGRIWCEDAAPRGAAFLIRLPKRQAA